MSTVKRPPSPATASATDDVAGRLRFVVTRLARLLRQQSDVGLTLTQLTTLATIDRCGPLPIGALADEEQVGASAATKIVDKLHAAGYVERHDDDVDRRVRRVAISPHGEQLLREIRARRTAWLSTRLADLSHADLHVLSEALAVLERLAAPPSVTKRPLAEAST